MEARGALRELLLQEELNDVMNPPVFTKKDGAVRASDIPPILGSRKMRRAAAKQLRKEG